MKAQQEAHYRSLRSRDSKAAYLVQIHEAGSFSEACSLMARGRRHRRQVSRAEKDRREARARAANYYFE